MNDVQKAVERMEFNLGHLAKLCSAPPDVMRQLGEDFDTMRAALPPPQPPAETPDPPQPPAEDLPDVDWPTQPDRPVEPTTRRGRRS